MSPALIPVLQGAYEITPGNLCKFVMDVVDWQRDVMRWHNLKVRISSGGTRLYLDTEDGRLTGEVEIIPLPDNKTRVTVWYWDRWAIEEDVAIRKDIATLTYQREIYLHLAREIRDLTGECEYFALDTAQAEPTTKPSELEIPSIDNIATGTVVPVPENGASVFDWLDYREAEKKAGHQITYKMLAEQSHYKEGTFKQKANRWKLERGIPD